MTEPAPFDPATTTTITLAGKDWPIPELAWRDLRKCRRELLEMNGRINAAVAASEAEAPEGESEDGRRGRHFVAMGALFADLTNEDFDRLVMGPILAALQAAHPDLKREEFEAWPSAEAERQMAWLTVRRQSGLFLFGGEAGAGDEPGEGEGAP
ncbi:MAG TPA: hypothetical protein VGH15_05895 [Caulobacteraceae bacterium]|jgi:hypothetical protein